MWHFEHRLSQTTFHYNHQSSGVSKLGLFLAMKNGQFSTDNFLYNKQIQMPLIQSLKSILINMKSGDSTSRLQSRARPWSCEPELASAEEDTLFCVNTNCFQLLAAAEWRHLLIGNTTKTYDYLATQKLKKNISGSRLIDNSRLLLSSTLELRVNQNFWWWVIFTLPSISINIYIGEWGRHDLN